MSVKDESEVLDTNDDDLGVEGAFDLDETGDDLDDAHSPSLGSEETLALINQYKNEAETIGYTGTAAARYIEGALKEYKTNQVRKAQKIMEIKKLKSADAQRRLEIEKLRFAREQRQHEVDMQKRNAELKQKEMTHSEAVNAEKLRLKREEKQNASKPKLPYFDDKVDDMEAYLTRFESHAMTMKWDRESWATVLFSLLRGKALTYAQELGPTDAQSYTKLSSHLLRSYSCTEDGFRQHFRSVKPEQDELMSVFFSRLKRYFTRWINAAEVGESFKKLCDLLLREQFLSVCSRPLNVFLKQSDLKDAESLVAAAERYREAHPQQQMSNISVQSDSIASAGFSVDRGRFPGRRRWQKGQTRGAYQSSDVADSKPSEQGSRASRGQGRGLYQSDFSGPCHRSNDHSSRRSGKFSGMML
jgi:hypothetical protein